MGKTVRYRLLTYNGVGKQYMVGEVYEHAGRSLVYIKNNRGAEHGVLLKDICNIL